MAHGPPVADAIGPAQEGAVQDESEASVKDNPAHRSAEIELRWYYEDARIPGFRSPLGLQLEMLRTGILFCQRTYTEKDAVPEQYLKDRERAIEIEARLLHLSEHHQRVLWLAFGHGGRIGDGPTMALCSEMQETKAPYLKDVAAIVARAVKKGWKKSPPIPTIRGWLFRIGLRAKASDGMAQRELLEMILAEAMKERVAALDAYVRAG